MGREDQHDDSSIATRSDTLQILVVDDEPDLRELIEYNLRQGGHEVLSAGNGQEALELAKARLPDVIVLDVMMPNLDGLGTMAALRQRPALAVTLCDMPGKPHMIHIRHLSHKCYQ